MSGAIFPDLPGLTWNRKRTPVWKTVVQQAASGRETRAALRAYPLWEWELKYDLLRSAAAFGELQTLVGFYNARRGAWDSFLFTDPDDASVTGQSLGTGDGATTAFQCIRTYGGFIEPVYDLNGTPTVYVAGSPTSAFTVGTDGVINFTAAPALGAAVTATFSYYWRVRFGEDSAEFNQFMYQLYELQTLKLVQVRP